MKQSTINIVSGLVAAVAIAPLMATTAAAQSAYDWHSGNSYSVYGNNQSGGLYGYNGRTGSTWTQQWNGSQYSGTDARGNFYTGNRNTGYYNNLGTGQTCIGQGYARVCN